MSSREALFSGALGWPTKAEQPGRRQVFSLVPRSLDTSCCSRRRARRCPRTRIIKTLGVPFVERMESPSAEKAPEVAST